MFNIKYKGNYISDEQLIKREIPKNAEEFGKIKSIKNELGKGFLMMLPLFILMIVLIYFKVKDLDYHLSMNIEVIVSFFIVIISVYLLTFVHEVIHALFYPLKSQKEIWKSKKDGAYFVYCEDAISKKRYIIMVLAPMFILGIIPFIIWLLLPNIIPMPYNIAVVIIFLLMTIVAMGDVSNIYYVLKEVPKKHKLFNYGLLRSFYIKED